MNFFNYIVFLSKPEPWTNEENSFCFQTMFVITDSITRIYCRNPLIFLLHVLYNPFYKKNESVVPISC